MREEVQVKDKDRISFNMRILERDDVTRRRHITSSEKTRLTLTAILID